MQDTPNDPLLLAAKGVIYFMLGILAFAGFFVVLGIPATLIFGADLGANIEAAELPRYAYWLIALLLTGVAGLLYLAFMFFRNMLRIVQSVGEGDPFVPENADRLTRMAWLMLALNLIALPVAGLGLYIAKLAGEQPGTIDAGFDVGGIVLVLTLFVLARVFRHGTALREDLEGTV
ncbi:DUF2975 domain-containing protein [Erythrobacter sp. JK5]|uniref:DUF2975 domain-containing protein n=1 Tax=Erythrobacter sp. JK5 TaxID=2829500 RepID=UPI001BA8A8AC|nr:DUF2975 domain-containing protein [Erythrobacter sp. JK5]QUL37556.1 DUF2975 domain-containing protein [Erythrobacter sp. JK5]